jgi:hypothetical protein
MKKIYIVFMFFLATIIQCDLPHKFLLERFMDKYPEELFKIDHLFFNKDFKIFEENLKEIKETN